MVFTRWAKVHGKKALKDMTTREAYVMLLQFVKEKSEGKKKSKAKKRLYYVSAEFLIGKLLSNNLINLGLYDEVKADCEKAGLDFGKIEEFEPEPSLGNGGLGRLASCFLDSLATLKLPGDGMGLLYHYGLFHQEFEACKQKEVPDKWLSAKNWTTKTKTVYEVPYADFSVKARMYDIDVTGYEGTVNTLHLFDCESVDETIVNKGSIDFPKADIAKNLTLFLYPDDSDEAGRLLRVYQQYFMVSASAQYILEEAKKRGSNLHDLADYVAIQINDTHPSMIIPEMIRLMMQEGILLYEGMEIMTNVCGYTNHTILAEALEKWPLDFLMKVAPQIVTIIQAMDAVMKYRYPDKAVAIIDDDHRVHMAHMDIHFSHSTNGVAALHTDILKHSELKAFYDIYPDRFNNKTNGITFRRFLVHSNPRLTSLIESKIGKGFYKNADELEKLLAYKDDEAFLNELLAVKDACKDDLAAAILKKQHIEVDPNSIFDVMAKRLHEYKRQQLNALYIIHRYLEIKKGYKPERPITVIFGAKAAPAYVIAKDIIHLILCLSEIINNDPEVAPYMKVVMLENYNITWAEKLFPAADISEQISLASKEASGTGNMKLMLNGAVTLGTEDGANVEIHQAVGDENIYIFGEDSDTVIARYARGDYKSIKYYKTNKALKAAVDFIVSKDMLAVGDKVSLNRLRDEMLNKDWFMTFPDFAAYVETKDRVLEDYEDRMAWAKKMLVNIAMAGFFSSDRTIEEYNNDIWHLK